jgi:DNA-binding transcriptional regulator YhcF (GntR family)/DNA-binding LacI/PurR family transcriptional regulator
MNIRPQKDTLFSQTRRKIISWLIDEQIKPGEKLPSKRDFALKYKVGEITVLNAINSLAEVGVVRKTPSRGTYLLSPPRRPVLIDAYFPNEWRDVIMGNDTSQHSYFIYRNYLDGLILSSSEFDTAITVEYTSDFNSLASARQTLARDGAIFFIYGNDDLFASLKERGIPFAHVTTGKSRRNNEVGSSHDKAAGEALRKLKESGKKTAGLIDFPKNQGPEKDTMQSARNKLTELNFDLKNEFVYSLTPFTSHEDAFMNTSNFIRTMKSLPDIFISGSSYQLKVFLRASESLGVNLRGVSFLSLDSRLTVNEPDYNILFSDPPHFKQSYEAARKVAECARNGQCVFPGEDIDAEARF